MNRSETIWENSVYWVTDNNSALGLIIEIFIKASSVVTHSVQQQKEVINDLEALHSRGVGHKDSFEHLLLFY